MGVQVLCLTLSTLMQHCVKLKIFLTLLTTEKSNLFISLTLQREGQTFTMTHTNQQAPSQPSITAFCTIVEIFLEWLLDPWADRKLTILTTK